MSIRQRVCRLVREFVAAAPRSLLLLSLLLSCDAAHCQGQESVREMYAKAEHRIPMRDGVSLFTAVYMPVDAAPEKTYPILMLRTCYSVGPYGPDAYPAALGPNLKLQQDGYIFVFQDVRGCYMSEGTFQHLTPHRPDKSGPQDVDESTDTFDTIEWLLDHVPHHNGRVGLWGVSYPGFYAAAGMIDAHPALQAVSPQAPIADWWYDDFHHHGAFFLPHAFSFAVRHAQPRPKPTPLPAAAFEHGTPDGYQFYLDLGPLANANPQYMRDRVALWDDLVAHPNYDQYWQCRNLLPHLKRVAPAVLIVGGWFDAEDLYGPLQIYRRIEADNPGIANNLVMGPWQHGEWSRGRGDHLGNIEFGSCTAEYYRDWIERVFFQTHLKDGHAPTLPEATVFQTGANRWRQFDQWPPAQMQRRNLYLQRDEMLTFDAPDEPDAACDEFTSDPTRPVPFVEDISIGMDVAYMTGDQRFAARRPDVLVYQTKVLDKDLTLCGPLIAELFVSTSESDADWVVKLIDVFPPDAQDNQFVAPGQHLGNYQMMVRSEVIRGRFRDDPAQPKPFVANEPAPVKLPLQDVLHTFRQGHRLVIQIQSTWFPLVDRNPQKYVDSVFLAKPEDFVRAIHRVYRSASLPSHVEIGVLEE